jgi:ABC-type Mn2+/Zn2+ transport system ATPase subunit
VNVDITDCNSIDTATISIQPGRLNIKYGPNGTGKSTIAKASLLEAEVVREVLRKKW